MFGIDLKRIFSLQGLKYRDLVGIDFSGHILKIAHVRVFPHKKEVSHLFCRDVTGLADEDIAKALRDALSDMALNAPCFIDTVPPHVVITKNIEIPSTDPEEIKEILDLQAGRHTPYARDEIIIDHINIGTYRNNYSKILLLIVANSHIKRQMAVFDRVSLKLEKVLFAAEGIAWFVSRVLRWETQESPKVVLHMDEAVTDFLVLFKEKLIFVRSIPIGAEHFVGADEINLRRWAEEVRHSLEAYQSGDIEKDPSALLFLGASAETKDFERLLNEALHLPVQTLPYTRGVTMAPEAAQALSAAQRTSFLNCLGPVWAQEEAKVNLIPENIKLSISIQERGRDLIKAGIFALTLLVLFFSILISNIYFKGVYLEKLDTEYRSLNEKAKSLENDFTRVSLIRNYLLKRGYSLEVLAEFYDVLPPELKVDEIRFDDEGKFFVRGTAETMSVVFSFMEGLEKLRYFKDVKTRYTTKRKDGLKDVTDFEITSLLEKGAAES